MIVEYKIGDRFTIGELFPFKAEDVWQVTDVGTRVIVAINLTWYADQSYDKGPPYSTVEQVFDEYDRSMMVKVKSGD